MDRLTRKDLKTDKFAQEVEHSVEYVAEHRRQVVRYGSIALAAVLIAVAVYAFMQYRKGVRENDLKAALKVQNAVVGMQAPDGTLSFNTQDEKDKALLKALNDVATKHDGSDQGDIAHYYLGTFHADKGNLAEAAKHFQAVAEDGEENYASLAKLALAGVYQAQGKQADGEKLLRSLVAEPTLFVSKEQATIALARYIAETNPQEARKLLEPLRSGRSAVSRVALNALSEIPQGTTK